MPPAPGPIYHDMEKWFSDVNFVYYGLNPNEYQPFCPWAPFYAFRNPDTRRYTRPAKIRRPHLPPLSPVVATKIDRVAFTLILTMNWEMLWKGSLFHIAKSIEPAGQLCRDEKGCHTDVKLLFTSTIHTNRTEKLLTVSTSYWIRESIHDVDTLHWLEIEHTSYMSTEVHTLYLFYWVFRYSVNWETLGNVEEES